MCSKYNFYDIVFSLLKLFFFISILLIYDPPSNCSVLASACLGTFGTPLSNCVNYLVWIRITDERSVSEKRKWSILLIKSISKLCIHLSKSLVLLL